MHGDMGGYYEIRVTGPGREQFRLFCMLENADKRTLTARGLRGPTIAVITGAFAADFTPPSGTRGTVADGWIDINRKTNEEISWPGSS
ncbi:MAG TPA: hypothetical protein VK272_01680 [Solirubrobacteraceae bacterium]|nr:hypothetical protein [Solirubrobacteraceae bacterium]